MDSQTQHPIQFDEVADIYDYYVLTDMDIPFWLEECRSVRGKVLELMSGTGRVSIPLLKAGVNLTCVDYASKMLAQLSKKLMENRLSCSVECQDISSLRLKDRFELVIIPFQSFSEILDRTKRKLALERIRNHMLEGGAFICTLHNPSARQLTMDGTNRLIGEFACPNGDRLVVSSRISYDPTSQMATGVQIYHRRTSDGEVTDHRELAVAFYLFQKGEFEALAEEAGFDVDSVYGDYDREPYEAVSSPYMIWRLLRSATGTNSI